MAIHGGEPISRHTSSAVIADYGGKTRNISRYLPLRRAQKLPFISAMALQFDNIDCIIPFVSVNSVLKRLMLFGVFNFIDHYEILLFQLF